MTKKNIIRRLKNIGFEAHYSGKTKTFFIDNCTKFFQCILFSDIENSGFKLVKN